MTRFDIFTGTGKRRLPVRRRPRPSAAQHSHCRGDCACTDARSPTAFTSITRLWLRAIGILLPSPFAGEGWGGGCLILQNSYPPIALRAIDLPHKGGPERAVSRTR